MLAGNKELSEIRLKREAVDTLQVNLGMVCNQTCIHCHHSAGPGRTELMSSATCKKTLQFLDKNDIPVLDLTGGAPELNPNFKDMVKQARAMHKKVIVRSNLTVLFEDGMEGLPQFHADNGVDLVCSLPCYLEENVNSQRGSDVYRKSVSALKMLNELGYGTEGSGLSLYLVYNPGGAFLPGEQASLESAYRKNLKETHGVTFNHLYTIANMPIGRFARQLKADGRYDDYMGLLKESVNYDLLYNAMCRILVSVGWDGRIYDCDFNQALNLPIGGEHKKLWEFSMDEIMEKPVTLSEHCYGCIAGKGSSCTGALN